MNRSQILGCIAGFAMFMVVLLVPSVLDRQHAHEIQMTKLKMGCPIDDK